MWLALIPIEIFGEICSLFLDNMFWYGKKF